MPKKKTTTQEAPDKSAQEEDKDYKSPVQILEAVENTIDQLAVNLQSLTGSFANSQALMNRSMEKMVEHINKQTTVMNDFALQVQRLTRSQNVFGDIGSVMLEMQSHLEEEKNVMRTNKRELRAQTKEAIHFLDKLRNLLIDFQFYWREQ